MNRVDAAARAEHFRNLFDAVTRGIQDYNFGIGVDTCKQRRLIFDAAIDENDFMSGRRFGNESQFRNSRHVRKGI